MAYYKNSFTLPTNLFPTHEWPKKCKSIMCRQDRDGFSGGILQLGYDSELEPVSLGTLDGNC
jgi:hypothetical protein